MKTFIHHTTAIFILSINLIACNKNASQSSRLQASETRYYTTLTEAANKAKSDLVEALKINPNFNLSTTVSDLEQSEVRSEITQFMVNYDQLVALDSPMLDRISSSTGNTILSFYSNNAVQATATLNRNEKGYAITQLFNGEITADLNTLNNVNREKPSSISVYEVPNLKANIYQVRYGDVTSYYTQYSNRFDLSKEANLNELIAVLKEDALTFNRNYGELLKKGKLVD
jgi:hypothetical protein